MNCEQAINWNAIAAIAAAAGAFFTLVIAIANFLQMRSMLASRRDALMQQITSKASEILTLTKVRVGDDPGTWDESKSHFMEKLRRMENRARYTLDHQTEMRKSREAELFSTLVMLIVMADEIRYIKDRAPQNSPTSP